MDSQLEKKFLFQKYESNAHLLGFPLAVLTVWKVSKIPPSPHRFWVPQIYAQYQLFMRLFLFNRSCFQSFRQETAPFMETFETLILQELSSETHSSILYNETSSSTIDKTHLISIHTKNTLEMLSSLQTQQFNVQLNTHKHSSDHWL